MSKIVVLRVDLVVVFLAVKRVFGIKGVLNCGFDGGYGHGF